jgi:DNA-binding transcriptional ArsR family regulator
MATNDEIHQAVLVIDSRLRTIDGKVNLMVRANRDDLLDQLETSIKSKPLIGQIYVLLDGVRNQDQIVSELAKHGTSVTQPTVSRNLAHMSEEHGIVERVPGAGSRYRKNREMEKALNLTKKIEKWLAEGKRAAGRQGARAGAER